MFLNWFNFFFVDFFFDAECPGDDSDDAASSSAISCDCEGGM